MKIAAKEAEESLFWLELCKATDGIPSPDVLLDKAIILQKILNKIIGTSKSSRR